MEDKKHQLTETLKVLEVELDNSKTDLESIRHKLKIAQDYETELISRQIAASERTEELRVNFYNKSNEITEVHNKMKNEMDVFTGHFFKQLDIK